MALSQGDSQVSAPPEASISAAPSNMSSVAVDNQAGVSPISDADMTKNDQTMASLGLGKAQDFFGPPDEQKPDEKDDIEESPTPQRGEITDTKEPDTRGKEKDLSPENQKKLDDLQKTGANAYDQNDGDLAPVQKALQDQADLQGTNPDGSPKVQIHAYQTTDQTPLTSFYASFGNNRNEHEVTKELIDGSRRYGTDFPSNKAGYIGSVYGGNGPRT